jgi:hypothetical protein
MAMTNRYIEQAKADYEGEPIAITEHWDRYDEHHVIIKMKCGKEHYYLDWIGGKYANEPDEFDKLPFTIRKWRKL